jgi:hypothetical protein
MLIAMTLVFAPGCAKQDWIDRTLVTEDVTGPWAGNVRGGSFPAAFRFELEQQGSVVKGFFRLEGGTAVQSGRFSGGGPLEGTVAGDVFRFREARGGLEGELKVSGDEMNGMVSMFGQRPFSLRRVDPTSPPGSPPR